MSNKCECTIRLIKEHEKIAEFCFGAELCKNENAALKECFDRAWKDCGQGYRYLGARFTKLKDDVFKYIKKMTCNKKEIQFSRNLINDVEGVLKFKHLTRTRFGAAQKIINMLFKYLFLYQDFTGINIQKPQELDCPLDSRILNELKKNDEWKQIKNNKLRDIKWTQLLEDEYKDVQECIDRVIKRKMAENSGLKKLYKSCNRLAFDFYYWNQSDNA